MASDAYPSWRVPDETVERVREALGEGWRVARCEVPSMAGGDGARKAPDELTREIEDAEIYIGFGISRDLFLAARGLRWVHSGAAGVRGSLFEEMRASDVLLTNSAGIYAEPLAEWAIAGMLHFARGFDIAAGGRADRRWRYEDMAGPGSPLRELGGATALVVGYGGIGSAIGRRAAALEMRVLAIRRRPSVRPASGAARVAGPEALAELLPEADYVVLALPERRDRSVLIGAAELARMRPGAVLMNLARGSIVNEDALVAALRSGRLRGAALDVFRTEPLPPDSPLWGMENVLITPHAGAISHRFWERQTALILENIGRYLRGEPLANLVDKEEGY